MSKDNQESALEPGLRAVWSRTQQRHFCAGLLALCCWGIPLFLVGVLIDWLAYLPTTGRAAVLLVLVSVSFYQAWKHGWRRISVDSTPLEPHWRSKTSKAASRVCL